MKTFRVTTSVPAMVTVEYVVEANSAEEAEEIIASGDIRDDGEEVYIDMDWDSEVIDTTEPEA